MMRLLCFLAVGSVAAVPELKLLHVVFTHKLYAPSQDVFTTNGTQLPNNLTYEHFYEAALDMSNSAKLTLYNLGVHLRTKYNEFLGDSYIAEETKVRTTEFPLSIISAELVNAGLWPPSGSQVWMNGFDWQPIPTNYLPLEKDTLLLGALCPNFRLDKDKITKKENIRKIVDHHRPLFDYITNHTGVNVTLPSQVALLYSTLETFVKQGVPLPKWSDGIFPDGEMFNVTQLEYESLSYTTLQQQLNGGTFIKEFIVNCLNFIQNKPSGIVQTKLFMYSGDNTNIAGILTILGLWSSYIPTEADAIIFEFYHDSDTDDYGFQINYYSEPDNLTIPLQIPYCENMCELKKFINLSFSMIPENEEELCGWNNYKRNEDSTIKPENYASRQRPILTYIIVIFSLILLIE